MNVLGCGAFMPFRDEEEVTLKPIGVTGGYVFSPDRDREGESVAEGGEGITKTQNLLRSCVL